MAAKKLAQLIKDARREGWAHMIRTAADERAVLDGCKFDPAPGRRFALYCSEFCRNVKGGPQAGTALELAEWQRENITDPLFGWYREDASGKRVRRFRRASIWLPKKNGKSTLIGAIATYLGGADNEPGAEIYLAANSKDQARKTIFETVAAFIRASPILRAHWKITKSQGLITARSDQATWIQTLACDSATLEGLNAHGVFMDELHAAKNRATFDALRWAGAARVQPLFCIISTAGDDVSGIGYEEFSAAKAIATSERDDEIDLLGVVAEAKPDADPGKVATWRSANPMLDVTLPVDSIREAWNASKHTAAGIAAFRRYRLNQWLATDTAWINVDSWATCKDDAITEASLIGLPCSIGIDLATKTDMTAFVLSFLRDDGKLHLMPRFFLPSDGLVERERRDRAPYAEWARLGLLRLTDGDVVDYAVVKAELTEALHQWKPWVVAYDPYSAEQLTQELVAACGVERREFRQTFEAIGPATASFERKVRSGEIAHSGHAILDRQIRDCRVKSNPAGYIRPAKSDGSGRRTVWRRIDGVVASIMSCGVWDLPEAPQRVSTMSFSLDSIY